MKSKLIWAGLIALIIISLKAGLVDAIIYFIISGHIRLINFTVPPQAMLVLWIAIIPLLIATTLSRDLYLPLLKRLYRKFTTIIFLHILRQNPLFPLAIINTLIDKRNKPDDKPIKQKQLLARYQQLPQS